MRAGPTSLAECVGQRIVTGVSPSRPRGTGAIAATGRTPADTPIVAAVARRDRDAVHASGSDRRRPSTPCSPTPAIPTAGLRTTLVTSGARPTTGCTSSKPSPCPRRPGGLVMSITITLNGVGNQRSTANPFETLLAVLRAPRSWSACATGPTPARRAPPPCWSMAVWSTPTACSQAQADGHEVMTVEALQPTRTATRSRRRSWPPARCSPATRPRR